MPFGKRSSRIYSKRPHQKGFKLNKDDRIGNATPSGICASRECSCLMAEIIAQRATCCMSGSSFAKAIMERRLTSLIAALKDCQFRRSKILRERNLRVSFFRDDMGVEVGGAIRIVLAIAAGIVEGMD